VDYKQHIIRLEEKIHPPFMNMNIIPPKIEDLDVSERKNREEMTKKGNIKT